MGKTGRLYPPEFKEEAIRLVHSCEEKYPVAKVACDLDVSAETLHKWVKQADVDAGVAESFVSTLERELIHRQSWLNRQISWERKARSAMLWSTEKASRSV